MEVEVEGLHYWFDEGKGGMVVGLVDEGRGSAGNGGRGEFFGGYGCVFG